MIISRIWRTNLMMRISENHEIEHFIKTDILEKSSFLPIQYKIRQKKCTYADTYYAHVATKYT